MLYDWKSSPSFIILWSCPFIIRPIDLYDIISKIPFYPIVCIWLFVIFLFSLSGMLWSFAIGCVRWIIVKKGQSDRVVWWRCIHQKIFKNFVWLLTEINNYLLRSFTYGRIYKSVDCTWSIIFGGLMDNGLCCNRRNATLVILVFLLNDHWLWYKPFLFCVCCWRQQ